MKRILYLFLFLPFITHAQVIVTDVAGNPTNHVLGDGGPAYDAWLSDPQGVALDDSGNLYICDGINNRIRKVSPGYGGTITTVAGDSSNYILFFPVAVAVDRHGNMYVAALGNSVIRKITPQDIVTTVTGTGVAGYNGDSIQATTAQLNYPRGIAVDSIGNLFIADGPNHRIRKVDTNGIITTIAGTGIYGYTGDSGMATMATLSYPNSIAIDRFQNIYIADSNYVRKINNAGIITTVAGHSFTNYQPGDIGDGGPAIDAEIGPEAIALDSTGNIFIIDGGCNRVRKVGLDGIINTIAGNGQYGNSGDGGNPLDASFDNPVGIVVGKDSNIYISCSSNTNNVRLITNHPLGVANTNKQESGISVYPNPSNGAFQLQVTSGISEQTVITVTNILGETIGSFSVAINRMSDVTLQQPPGIYFLSATIHGNVLSSKIIIQ